MGEPAGVLTLGPSPTGEGSPLARYQVNTLLRHVNVHREDAHTTAMTLAQIATLVQVRNALTSVLGEFLGE